MKTQTVIDVLLREGIAGDQILKRFTDAGPAIAITVTHGKLTGIVHGLIPIDDNGDEPFARALLRAARKAEEHGP